MEIFIALVAVVAFVVLAWNLPMPKEALADLKLKQAAEELGASSNSIVRITQDGKRIVLYEAT